MTTSASSVERKYTGSMPYVLADTDITGLATSRSKTSEIWSLLEYYYAIDVSRDDFLKQKGITSRQQRKRVGAAFKSYIVQARNFYGYAKSSDYRSASLLYYYSFLNLAKAKLVTENPTWINKKFYHGVKRKVTTGDINSLSCTISPSRGPNQIATFHELYNLRFGSYMDPKHSASLKDLLGYSTDIQHEYTETLSQRAKITPVKYLICIDKDRKKCWNKIAVYDWGRHAANKKTFKDFLEEFQQINISSMSRQLSFDMSPHVLPWYTFFEAKTEFDFIGTDGVNTWNCNAQLKNLLKNHYQPDLFERTHGFQMVSPLRKSLQIPFDELTATYMAMFHLSEIVRYQPDYIEEILSDKTKSGWLIRNFVEQSSVTFLIQMVSWITGKNYFIQHR